MTPVTVGSLCHGYGGIEMGLHLAGVDVDLRWLAETEPALDPLHPTGVPNLGNLTAVDWSTVERVDLLTAGFPCQPVSAAGAQLGERDPRWLWPWVRDVVQALRPRRVLLENVRNLISIRKGALWSGILDDLTGLGYSVRWLTLGACAVGAAHHRHRVFALAEVTTGSVPVTERLDVDECGARKGSTVLPTPTVHDSTGRGAGDADYWQRRRSTGRNHGLPLDAVVALLPTPTAGEASGGRRDRPPGPGGRIHRPDGSSHGIALSGAVTLLPTPRATDGVNGGPGQRGSSGDLAMSSAVQPEHWGRFAAAIARHGALFGEPPRADRGQPQRRAAAGCRVR